MPAFIENLSTESEAVAIIVAAHNAALAVANPNQSKKDQEYVKNFTEIHAALKEATGKTRSTGAPTGPPKRS